MLSRMLRSIPTPSIPTISQTARFAGLAVRRRLFRPKCQMNKLAEALGMDPVEMRMRNLLGEGDMLSVGTPLPAGVSIQRWLKHAREGRLAARSAGLVPAGAVHRYEQPSSRISSAGLVLPAPIKMWVFRLARRNNAGRLSNYTARRRSSRQWCTMPGRTAGRARILSLRRLPLRPYICHWKRSSWCYPIPPPRQTSGSASASRMTFMAGNAIKGAAVQALGKWQQ